MIPHFDVHAAAGECRVKYANHAVITWCCTGPEMKYADRHLQCAQPQAALQSRSAVTSAAQFALRRPNLCPGLPTRGAAYWIPALRTSLQASFVARCESGCGAAVCLKGARGRSAGWLPRASSRTGRIDCRQATGWPVCAPRPRQLIPIPGCPMMPRRLRIASLGGQP